jgi:hypothetical protein
MTAFRDVTAPPSPSRARFETYIGGASGHDLHLDGLWRPVIGLGEAALRGHVLHMSVRESLGAMSTRPVEITSLNAVDIERIDITAAEYGFAVMPAAPASDQPPLAGLQAHVVEARTGGLLLAGIGEGCRIGHYPADGKPLKRLIPLNRQHLAEARC